MHGRPINNILNEETYHTHMLKKMGSPCNTLHGYADENAQQLVHTFLS